MKSAVISAIVEQHAEEAAFLWILRDAAVRAPHYRLKDLAKLDNRVEAHIDGLRIAGEEGWRLCEEGLRIGEAGEVFAAAMLAFEEQNGERIDTLVTVARQSDEAFRGLVSALGWIPPPGGAAANTYREFPDLSSSWHLRLRDPAKRSGRCHHCGTEGSGL